MSTSAVHSGRFFAQYQGHPVQLLAQVHAILLKENPGRPCIYLSGDSTVDNKHWLFRWYDQSSRALLEDIELGHFTAQAVNGYERALNPPYMVKDVSYWMNFLAASRDSNSFTLNTAVEASTLTERVGGVMCCCAPTCGKLLPHDVYIRDNIRREDVLVISVGGNDVALAPSVCTVLFMLLMMLTPWFLLCRMHPSILYFTYLFKSNGVRFIKKLTARTIPHKIGVAMVYNLDEANVSSWANSTLCCLCYSCAPGMLQYRMDLIFRYGISKIKIESAEVVPLRLADALDGKDTKDYRERVEPSISGGRKLATLILDKLGV